MPQIPLADVIAFGDGENDKELVEMAGTKCCHGQFHTRGPGRRGFVTRSNDDHGIYHALIELDSSRASDAPVGRVTQASIVPTLVLSLRRSQLPLAMSLSNSRINFSVLASLASMLRISSGRIDRPQYASLAASSVSITAPSNENPAKIPLLIE